jgi:hypothetical protein
MHQDPYLKTEKQKSEPIPIPIIETESPKRKRIIGSAPRFKAEELESGSETDSLPMHSKYIHNVLRRKAPHDHTFGVYQDDNSYFKRWRSSFKYNDQHVFVYGKKYKVTPGLWELLTKSQPDKNLMTLQDNHIKEYYSSLMRIEL